MKDMFAKVRKAKDKPPQKTVTVTLSFEMDEKTAKLFLQSSIERVINTSIQMIETVERIPNSAELFPHTSVNLEDWAEWKPAVCMMWNAIHDAIFRTRSDLPPSDRTYTITKGDL